MKVKLIIGIVALSAVIAAILAGVLVTYTRSKATPTTTATTTTTTSTTTTTTSTTTSETTTTSTATTTSTTTTTQTTTTTSRTTTSTSATTSTTTTASTTTATSTTTTTSRTTTSSTATTSTMTTSTTTTASTVTITSTTTRTSTTTTSSTTTTVTAGMTTTSTTTAGTINNCTAPLVPTPSGSCVNTRNDFNNCGAVGYVCPSNYTRCAGSRCKAVPIVQLSNPTAIMSGSEFDDSTASASIPFNITLYNTTTNSVTVSSNGVLCFGNCATAYSEESLPTSSFTSVTVFGYWDDLIINGGTQQGIYRAVQGTSPNRTLIFEYYATQYAAPTQYYQFHVMFFEALKNVVQIKYFDAYEEGSSCTVGVQASGTGPFIQYSYRLATAVQPSSILTFNTNLGTYSNSTF